MPQLNAYIEQELLDALDAKVREMKASTGIKTNRSALAGAALRAFLMPKCTEKSTNGLKKEDSASPAEAA